MADYERRKCSQCSEGLGFSEGEDGICDSCWLELETRAKGEETCSNPANSTDSQQEGEK